jgi:hypothetical protein
MLNSISWGLYITVIIALLICYYIYIGYKYFRWELLGFIGIKKIEPGTHNLTVTEFKQQITTENHADYLPKSTTGTDFNPAITSFKDEVTAYLKEAGADYETMGLLGSIQKICSKYPALKNIENRAELDSFLLKTINTSSSEEINLDDIQHLWH